MNAITKESKPRISMRETRIQYMRRVNQPSMFKEILGLMDNKGVIIFLIVIPMIYKVLELMK